MNAWVVQRPGPIDEGPLAFVERPLPEPGPNELRVRVAACGVCRTDLHLAEGDLTPHGQHVVPGHEIVGVVDRLGPGAARFGLGERVGIAWLRRTCGTCRFCRRGDENLCVDPRFTGWDADGGYAEYAVVDENYAYRLPGAFDDEQAAPLLCAGIIGFRALRRSALPTGGRLGIYGFGGSAHLAAQVALAEGATVHVMTRSPEARELALALGAASAGDTFEPPPEPLDSGTTPASPSPPTLPSDDTGLGTGAPAAPKRRATRSARKPAKKKTARRAAGRKKVAKKKTAGRTTARKKTAKKAKGRARKAAARGAKKRAGARARKGRSAKKRGRR